MTERILDKIDRLGAEAGILVMTTEIRRFALLIRADMLKTMPMPTVPDAIHHTDTSETLEYIQGWNDCRQLMLKMRKP